MSDNIDKKQNLIISYTEDKKNKQLSFPVSYNNIDINNDSDVKGNKMLKDAKGNATIDNFSTGDAGSTFDLTILTDNVSDIKALNKLYLNVTPFTIVLPPSILLKTLSNKTKWIIEKKDQSQDNKDYVVIKLTFHTYNPPKKITLLDTSLATLGSKFNKKCIKKNVDLNSKKARKKESDCNYLVNKIMDTCGYNVKVCPKYKKKKGKVVKDNKGKKVCAKKKTIPKKFTKNTKKALIKFKKEWNKYKLKPKLKKTGKNKKGKKVHNSYIDEDTKKALVHYNKLITAKKKQSKKDKKVSKKDKDKNKNKNKKKSSKK